MNFLSPGAIAGVLTLVAGVTAAAGYPVASAVLADPATAAHVTMIATGLSGLVAGILSNVRKPAA